MFEKNPTTKPLFFCCSFKFILCFLVIMKYKSYYFSAFPLFPVNLIPFLFVARHGRSRSFFLNFVSPSEICLNLTRNGLMTALICRIRPGFDA